LRRECPKRHKICAAIAQNLRKNLKKEREVGRKTKIFILQSIKRRCLSVFKYGFTDFGKTVKKRLIDLDKSQEWLISQINRDTGLFVDSSYLNRILTGRCNSEKIIASISKILDL
jgi:hypothetical protein